MPPQTLTLDMPVQWNSTYEMIRKACVLKVPITAVCATQTLDQSVKLLILTPSDWTLLDEVLQFFKIFVRPTRLLQGSTYPTLNYAIPQYLIIIKKLQKKQEDQPLQSPICQACIAAINKLEEYYNISQKAPHLAVATVCDLRFNFNVFNILQPTESQGDKDKRAGIKRHFQSCYSQYNDQETHVKAVAALEAISNESVDLELEDDDADSIDELFVNQGTFNADIEWNKWIKQPPVAQEVEILDYQKGKQYEFPTIARMARDHLAIPGSSAPSECVFSGGSDLVTKKRNQLGGDNIRRLLFMRDWGVLKECTGDGIDLESVEPEQLQFM